MKTLPSNMTKETVLLISDSESSTSSHDCNAVTVPSAVAQDSECSSKVPAVPTTQKPSKEHTQTSSERNSQKVTPLPLLPPPSSKPEKTTTKVVPSLPPLLPRSNKITPLVPIFPRPSGALQLHRSATEIGTRQHPVGVTLSRPLGGGSVLNNPLNLTSSLSHGRASGALQTNWLAFPQSFGSIGNRGRRQPSRSIFSLHGASNNQRYHPYMTRTNLLDLPYVANENSDSSRRTIDFLSQMEARSSEQMQGRRFLNPPNEILADWGAMLTLGNGRRPVDLNLRLRLG